MSGAPLRVGFASQIRRCAVDLQCWNPLFGGVQGGVWPAGVAGGMEGRSVVFRASGLCWKSNKERPMADSD
ncbi:hypothetical protein CMEL01_06505 [Colletotrichum melonis]|uniref:Uncharacterized protein n=1 Tax=Colletotrichum melonis TaxID=1209925 RepID=A0AAI9XJM1_9PEZI|nr:hypothetical protein CMEL01_06505 [Colletotrichum melonis]